MRQPGEMATTDRREFLRLLGCSGAAVALSGCGRDELRRRGGPNVLLVICDDLNDAVAGMGGHSQALTPNIDRFSQSAVRFTNAHCNSPLCGPSRASLWTGFYPHTTGYYGRDQNDNEWQRNPVMSDCVTVFEHFARHGYAIHGTGKIFHNNQATLPLFERGDGRGAFGEQMSYGPFAWDGKSDPWRARHPSMRPPWGRNGFETFARLSEVPRVAPDPATDTPGFAGWWDGKPFRYVSEEDRDLMTDERSANWAVQQLTAAAGDPFFMTVGFIRPHSPWIVPDRYFDLFPLETIELPPYLENDLEDCPQVYLRTLYGANSPGDGLMRLLEAYDGVEGWKRWVQGYLASVAFVDAQFGKILDALDASRHREDTIVIFTSDHGFHMGEKNWLYKLTTWEESTRVPLLVRVPGSTPANEPCDQPVSLIDLYPTLVDLARLPADPHRERNGLPLDGHSLRPLLEAPAHSSWDGPAAALSCIYGEYPVGRDEPGRIDQQHFSIRTRRWRYVLCNNGEEELYDHDQDPHEWHNLAAVAELADVKSRLKGQLLEMLHARA